MVRSHADGADSAPLARRGLGAGTREGLHVGTLDALAVRIREAHAEVEAGMRATLDAAMRAGELLAEAKGKVTHGEWGTWLADNFPASDRTARLYMRLAANRQALADFDGGVEQAAKLLAAPKPSEPEATGDVAAAAGMLYVSEAHYLGGIGICAIVPSDKHPGYSHVYIMHWSGREDEGGSLDFTGRPVRADVAMECAKLLHFPADETSWAAERGDTPHALDLGRTLRAVAEAGP